MSHHPQDCKIARLPEESWLQSCGWLVLQGMPSPARCIQDSPGNLAILQSCGWSVPQCKLRKLAFLMMMKEQSCKLFGRCVWFPVISGGQPPPEPTTNVGDTGLEDRLQAYVVGKQMCDGANWQTTCKKKSRVYTMQSELLQDLVPNVTVFRSSKRASWWR